MYQLQIDISKGVEP